ncbi:hypothetical protein ABIC55_003259 [Sporosarcina psychrophila]|uniref:Uncharacterized protein n=1 Tax=Sporosarcina psychrophila TaxID=1476 RepID=A0ABV2KB78_SPOPS
MIIDVALLTFAVAGLLSGIKILDLQKRIKRLEKK